LLLKKLHTLTLKSFLPPFIITLFVSVFLFFLVTVVITYLDDFIGKGLRTLDLLQLFTYAWIALIPQCIPLAVLLASIMSFGNLAENYELAAMKSSGLSLFRIIQPVLIFIVLLAALTFLFNNFILPVVELKSQSLLWDIRQKKPTVNIKEGIFYNKIDNYSIRVGRKSKNKDTLKEIFIYDHSARKGNNVQLYANSGKMGYSDDSSALVLTLRNGNRYEENTKQEKDKNGRVIRDNIKTMQQLSFRELQVNVEIDLKLKRTAEEQWKGSENMLNIWQLDSVADSTMRKIDRRTRDISTHVKQNFFFRTNSYQKAKLPYKAVSVRALYDSLEEKDFNTCMEGAMNIARNNSSFFDGVISGMTGDKLDVLKYRTEWHRRIVVCFACIVLFFIGAPLGAIIKKGGLGLPVVTAVFFFLAYFILTEAFTSVAYEGTLPPWQAVWAPLAIFLPISVFLTYKAANDSMLFDVNFYFGKLTSLFKRKKPA
jgi:lipopolysaccharide export system permease protein